MRLIIYTGNRLVYTLYTEKKNRNPPEKRVHRIGPAVHDAQDLARLARQVPAERQRVEMTEEVDRDLPRRVLLDANPQKG